MFAARHIVEKILSHQHHGGHERHHGGGGHHWGGRHLHGHRHGHHGHSDVMTKTEYALIDNFRIMGFLMLSAFIAISVSGCRALKAVRKGDSKFSDLVWKKTWRRIGWVVLMCVAIHHFGRECKHLLDVHNELRGAPQFGRPEFENRPEGPQYEVVVEEEPQPEDTEEPEQVPQEEDPEQMPQEDEPQEIESGAEAQEDENDDDEDEEETETGPGRHLRWRRNHHRKGGRKGKHNHNHKKGQAHKKSRKLRAAESKKQLMKELLALKK